MEILRALHSQVLPHREGSELQPYVRTLMAAARHFNEIRNDVASAVDLWTEAHTLNRTDGDRTGVVAIMMHVARKRADAELPPARRDVAGAVRIYGAVHGLDVSEDQNQRLVKTMMAVANLYTDMRLPPTQRDIPGAVALWEAILGMGLPRSEQDYVLRSMMNVANMLTDLRVPDREIDVDGAIVIWRSVGDHVGEDEDWQRTIRTMMALAGPRIGAYSNQDSVRIAMLLWHAAYRCAQADDDRLRVVKTIMDLASRFPAMCAHAIDELRQDRAEYDAPGFATEALAGLLYYQGKYEAVISLADNADRERSVTVAALRADALRKLGRYRSAIRACDHLVAECRKPGAGRPQHEALVSTLCCRGYANLELGKADAALLPRAETDLRDALDVSARTGVPKPPRAHMGLGYVYEQQGRHDEAETARTRAEQLDADNRKAAAGFAGSDRVDGADLHASDPGERKRALMNEARKRNELHNDVEGAIARWTEAYSTTFPGDESDSKKGARYAFYAERGPVTRGLVTAQAAPPLKHDIVASGLPPVWPDPEGSSRGETLMPLHRSVPVVAREDAQMYELLALFDALRVGRARERKLAQAYLEERL